jgi:predicted metal-dependent hydrolase
LRALLRRLERLAAPKPIPPAEIEIAGRVLPIEFKRNAQARRIVLRLTRNSDGIAVTVPRGASRTEALAFVDRSRTWIAGRLARAPTLIKLGPGTTVPLRGEPHDVRPMFGRRGAVLAISRAIWVPGGPDHCGRRLRDWLIDEARRDLLAASEKYAAMMAVRIRRLSVRDQKGRWGSCSSSGDLSYSWRLILAPPHVLDYVAAHEVAHLRHMNHGPRFWRLVLTHCPEAPRAKRWLKGNGAELHRYC